MGDYSAGVVLVVLVFHEVESLTSIESKLLLERVGICQPVDYYASVKQ